LKKLKLVGKLDLTWHKVFTLDVPFRPRRCAFDSLRLCYQAASSIGTAKFPGMESHNHVGQLVGFTLAVSNVQDGHAGLTMKRF